MILLDAHSWEVRQTKNKGRGLFAKRDIESGIVIGDYLGKVIRTADAVVDEQAGVYLMYYSDRAVISPDLTRPGIHLLNHSCRPNCWIYTYFGHTLFFTLRKILAGEELTISYLISPRDEFCNPCVHICKCGSVGCRQNMHMTLENYKRWRKFWDKQVKNTKRVRVRFGTDLPPLESYPEKIAIDSIYRELSV